MDSVNKYDSGFSLPGATELKALMEAQDFQTKLQELGYSLSKYGNGYGIVIFKHQKDFFIETVQVFDLKKQFGRVIDVRVSTDDTLVIRQNTDEQETVDILARFYYDGDKVMRENGYWIETSNTRDWVATTEPIDYNSEVIPVFSGKNTPLGLPDLLPEADKIIEDMNHLYNSLPIEWEKAKLQMAFNELLDSTQGADNYEKTIIKDKKSTLSVSDTDSLIGNAMAPINLGTMTIQQAMQSIGFYDSKIREMCFLFRDHGSDSRKNEMDLLLYNQKAYEHFENKLAFRQRQLQQIINLFSAVTGFKGGKVKLNTAPFEQFRMDNLKAIADLKVATAEQARGVAEKNRMEAESMRVNLERGNTVDVTQTQAETAIQETATTEETVTEEEQDV